MPLETEQALAGGFECGALCHDALVTGGILLVSLVAVRAIYRSFVSQDKGALTGRQGKIL